MIRTLNWKSPESFPIHFTNNVFKTQKNNNTLFSLIILYKVNYFHPFGHRKQKLSRLYRTASLNTK